jgi:hypothetical protein
MDASLYTGNGTSQTIVNSGAMAPDLVWMKSRSAALDNYLLDTNRGPGDILVSNSTAASVVLGAQIAFNSNGFSVGGLNAMNQNAATFVGWQWKAGGTAVSNTAGTITSQVSANTTSGFSVVTYTGTGTANSTVGHGLGVAPQMILVKARNSGVYNWNSYHVGLTPGFYISINTTSVQDNSVSIFPSGGVTSTNWNTGASPIYNNGSGVTYVAYCWAPVAGYSKFGSYTGNGSADGPFVYLGFRPRWIMIKKTDSTSDWWIWDTARNTYNQMNTVLYPNLSSAEVVDPVFNFDALSNGFKNRSSNATVNGSGGTYIYAAFAENPFKYALAR